MKYNENYNDAKKVNEYEVACCNTVGSYDGQDD